MTDWCIVAIPETSDRVWRRSSEKIPHMTLLFLGEQDDPELARHIALQIQHTVNTSLTEFSASVDSRGVLGPKNADVLFFDQLEFPKEVLEFRGLLLQDAAIRSCYDSAEQFPSFTPHLTLGYPDKPAKPPKGDWDDDEWRYVHFNKIAFWIAEDDGPEFEMSYRPGHTKGVVSKVDPYSDYMSDSPAPMAHSRTSYVHVPTPHLGHLPRGAQSTSFMRPVMDVLEDTLQHTLEVTEYLSEDETYLAHAEIGGLKVKSTLRESYDREHQVALEKSLKHAVGGRPSETAHIRFLVTSLPDNDWLVSTINSIEHTGTAETRIHPFRDENGLIEDYIVISDNVQPGDLKYAIQHYGVKGMKWGVRRKASQLLSSAGAAARAKRSSMAEARSLKKTVKSENKAIAKTNKAAAKASQKEKRQADKQFEKDARFKRPVTEDAVAATKGRNKAGKHGTDALSNKELQSLVTRMNLEQQLANLKDNEKASKARNSGRTYLNDLMKDAGKTFVNEAVTYAAQEGMKAAFAKAGEAKEARQERRANYRPSTRGGTPELPPGILRRALTPGR